MSMNHGSSIHSVDAQAPTRPQGGAPVAVDVARQIAYWQKTLADLPERLTLPTDRPRLAPISQRGDSVDMAIAASLHGQLMDLASRTESSLFIVLHAALTAWLYRMGAGTDLPLSTPLASGLEHGLTDASTNAFVDHLILRVDVSGNPRFIEWLGRVRAADLDAYASRELPAPQIAACMTPASSALPHSLSQVMLAVHGGDDVAASFCASISATSATPLPGPTDNRRFELAFNFNEQGSADQTLARLSGHLTYACDLFDHDTAAALAQRFVRFLQALADNPDIAIGQIDLLSADERRQILVDWNATSQPVADTSLSELFERQARQTPDAIAVISGEARLSYGALNTAANRLAHDLIAVLKCGAAYLPLDPDYPTERLLTMIDDARPTRIIADASTIARLPADTPHWLIDAELPRPAAAQATSHDPAQHERVRPLLAQHPAALIYTSGSTGKPKGVVVTQRNLADFMAWASAAFDTHELSHVWATTSLNFDVSIFEIFTPLANGGCIELLRNALALGERSSWSGHLVSGVPSVFSGLVEHPSLDIAAHTIVMAGEALPPALFKAMRTRAPAARLANLYGPTEATVYALGWFAEAGSDSDVPPPIGRPLSNTRVYVLDAGLQPLPAGVAGELYLAGEGLARGYLHRPALTAERFVAHPYEPGQRMYRTGDLVRWRKDGQLDYLGRADSQVKIRGFRSELGEIESCLMRQPAVAQATVVAREDSAGLKQLVAYIVPLAGHSLDLPALRHGLSAKLPYYMVPAALVVLTAMPLNSNGKLDRKALPAPVDAAFVRRDYEAPRGDVETTLASLWQELIGVERVGRHDHFFELGGHSLLAIQLMERLRRLGLSTEIHACRRMRLARTAWH
ncbi:non-ribosomal peptide synthetase [Dyella silvatica]|uniref:non-ribosomal peptide synthetase n=1 Tax=Dyella silvatica TaxID=2992128 RepID=UPI00225B94F4|nr:amino acid adenylation domain-containing protein [Dyella silvatica]